MKSLAVAEISVLDDDASLMRRVLAWTASAYPHERADAVNALARAYLYCDLAPEARGYAGIALTQALDDPEPLVRRALAEAFASSPNAPRHVVLALVQDISEVSRGVLSHSPLLGEADLVDCVGYGDARAQTAIARRARLSGPVAAALAEVGERAAVLALIANLDAELAKSALWRVFQRFQDDAGLRERLAERPGLPAALRAALAAAATQDMSDLAADRQWLEPRRAQRVARDGREQAFVAIAAQAAEAELPELVSWLCEAGHLTIGLLMRGLACGDVRLITQSLAEMSGLPPARVAGWLADACGQGFAALYARAGLPAPLLQAFRIAAVCVTEAGAGGAAIGVNHALTMNMLRVIEAKGEPAFAPVAAMLGRFAAEGARADAREFSAPVVAPDLAPALETEPALETTAPPVLLLDVEPGNENFAPPVALDAPSAAAA